MGCAPLNRPCSGEGRGEAGPGCGLLLLLLLVGCCAGVGSVPFGVALVSVPFEELPLDLEVVAVVEASDPAPDGPPCGFPEALLLLLLLLLPALRLVLPVLLGAAPAG